MIPPNIIQEAQKVGEAAVEEFVAKYGETMYCGVAYLYYLIPLPKKPRERKIRYRDERLRISGRFAGTQSLDLQEKWCEAASEVFKKAGYSVFSKSWVD